MVLAKRDYETLSDLDLTRLMAARDPAAVRLVTQRNNQRLFRTAWSILKNRAEAEDAVQSAYLHALAAIGDFEGRSSLSTWLTRIVINEALGRARTTRRRAARLDADSIVDLDLYREKFMQGSMTADRPDSALAREQVRRLLEAAVARLPQDFRTVFVLREIEGSASRKPRRRSILCRRPSKRGCCVLAVGFRRILRPRSARRSAVPFPSPAWIARR